MRKTDELLGLAVACQQLGIAYQDGHRLRLTGRLRGDKRGGRWFVNRESIERVAREREREAAERYAPVPLAFVLPQYVDIDAPHLLKGVSLAILVLVWRAGKRAVAWKSQYLECGERRRNHVGVNGGRRVWDRHPCHHFFVPGTKWVIRVALPKVHKVW
jgi:hypothetical protein